ncbi:MAG: bifunctional diaminohydroxyphosphoribosylaminopyrimidine deaminase/5-amino-6-(5-phosphoribosylamino)uracil reductase RibD [Candidatus Magasanikbacteria bacterium]|nr:bifunctional diaminohydroxyphosphoribosylaminopyrimidine deaminase/5-amino-6-(5-phosphoribosylamino)uracil reductase RibD [Candidatus Magasanikbacteria bacterium]
MPSPIDQHYMSRALELAEQGAGWVAPNPLVGAVIVKDGQIIGEGYHATYGEAHAEVIALKNAAARGENVAGATLYVTLEPCNHTGKQPPCTKAILESKIAHVVFAAPDPNQDVAGGGAVKLRSAELIVEDGMLVTEARYQNRIYFHWIAHHKPYVVAKVAVSKNNKLTAREGARTAISGPEAWEFVQTLRQRCDAIMVGARTVKIDNPELTVRSQKITRPRNPLRVIISGQATIPPDAKIFNDKNTLVLTSNAQITVATILRELARRNITSVLVEGGARLLQHFFKSGLVNEWIIIRSPKIFNAGVDFIKEPQRLTEKFLLDHTNQIGADTIEYYAPHQ